MRMTATLEVLCLLLLKSTLLLASSSKKSWYGEEKHVGYLQQTYRTYSNCVIHIVDLIGTLELPPSEVPILFDMLRAELELLGKLSDGSAEFKKKLDAMAIKRLRNASAVAKITNFNCYVTFIAVLNFQAPSLDQLFQAQYSSAIALWTIIRQDITLGLKTPWEVHSDAQKYWKVYYYVKH